MMVFGTGDFWMDKKQIKMKYPSIHRMDGWIGIHPSTYPFGTGDLENVYEGFRYRGLRLQCRFLLWNLKFGSDLKSRFLDMLHKSVIKSDVAIEFMWNPQIERDDITCVGFIGKMKRFTFVH